MAAAIVVENLSKRYRLPTSGAERLPYRTLRDDLARWATWPLRWLRGETGNAEEFWALKDVSFEVQPGEVVGIIGRNGAGKSTLLKVLSRITRPTAGRVRLRGRVGSLLEVGTGFHPELTGRENIFLSGAVLGMRRAEIRRKFDEIVAFAEVEKFLDLPVKRYSSGMYMRLAFAVAAHLDPEILLVDEVLAVGDAAFQKKCLGKMGEVAKSGRTVLMVSHDLGAVSRICRQVIQLDAGEIEAQGPAPAVVESYLAATKNPMPCQPIAADRCTLQSAKVLNLDGSDEPLVCDRGWQIQICYDIHEELRAGASVRVAQAGGAVVFDSHEFIGEAPVRPAGSYVTTYAIQDANLCPGLYSLSAHIMTHYQAVYLSALDYLTFYVVGAATGNNGSVHVFNQGGVVVVNPAIATRQLSH